MGLIGLVVVLAVLLVLWPISTLIGIIAAVSLIFLTGTVFKFVVAMIGAKYDVVERITAQEIAELTDEELPVYTVLVPVANIVAQLVRNLGDIDYPKSKLEVLLLIEEEDHETLDALEGANPPTTSTW